ncbi:hypothetical protein DBV15_00606 [Temnothorax longispinosus]|uniref:Uncharacterized protein n=1 Tax=Temnothorax longispinosus TaxID=300112 RepID=A0A4S2KT45_9HYME|nr:hypothetical protein DBV15_00606 [Temnothorax longispinosus]
MQNSYANLKRQKRFTIGHNFNPNRCIANVASVTEGFLPSHQSVVTQEGTFKDHAIYNARAARVWPYFRRNFNPGASQIVSAFRAECRNFSFARRGFRTGGGGGRYGGEGWRRIAVTSSEHGGRRARMEDGERRIEAPGDLGNQT